MSLDDDDGGPCNTQQETRTYDSIDDHVLTFPDHHHQIEKDNNTPYSVLVPLAKELSSILEGNCTAEELEVYKQMLLDCIVEKKNEIKNDSGKTNSGGKMISSSVRSNKKHKTHGTKHMTFQ